MVRERRAETFDAWLTACQGSHVLELYNFARVLQRDYAAVTAALTVPWSNGQVEGQIHRLKYMQQSEYGRANFDLLRQRMLHRA